MSILTQGLNAQARLAAVIEQDRRRRYYSTSHEYVNRPRLYAHLAKLAKTATEDN